MSFWKDWFLRDMRVSPASMPKDIQIGATADPIMTYNDKSITFTGDLADYDYNTILRDKQRNIIRLYELADYFVDADPIYRGIVKGVYTPFALHNPYRLVGSNERVKAKYEEYYERIHLHEVIQPDTKEMFDKEKYREVNAEILAAGGISGIIVSGRAEDGSNFASAQVSMQTAAMRIAQAQVNFAEMMNKVNQRLNGTHGGITHSMPDNVPRFVYPPVDLSGSTKFQETCFKLWQSGVLSTQTMLQTHGYDIGQELERKKAEEKAGVSDALAQPEKKGGVPSNTETKGPGRPETDDTERTSDKGNSMTAKQPKPSNPEGSL